MKGKVAKLISGLSGIAEDKVEKLIEVPPEPSFGDFAFPCFFVAKKEKKDPHKVALELQNKIRDLPVEFARTEVRGAYLNFFVNKEIFARKVLSEASKKEFGRHRFGKKRIVLIDMSSPNIAKPFGVGHLRSTIIGNSIARILEFCGYKPIKLNYLGDWGTQFGKIIFAYKKWGDKKKLEENPTRHLFELYVKANDERYAEEARKEFRKLELKDAENTKLWKLFRKISIREFQKIYRMLGVKFDVICGESDYNEKMDEIVETLKEKGLVKKDAGALIVDLKSEGLGVALIQKADGTSLYATRDLAAAIDRKKKYKFYKMIYEVGSEQKLHFRQVFRILELMGYKWARDCLHISHGLYLGRDGKKFATRKGKTTHMEDVLRDVISKARKNLVSRECLDESELVRRAKKIAIAAIIYGDLKNFRENNIVFDIDKFLAFEGDTGPYLLYSYARASSIIRKVKQPSPLKIVSPSEVEFALLRKIFEFPDVVMRACDNYSPNVIANFSFELAQIFNEFYHSCPVIGTKEEGFRIKVVDAFRKTLKKSLFLLGIEVLEEM